ncbi:unnamed protein product [Ambrosiozyma monospora]|uniref:Unnamed protein product n=1 Tax=Ambrosiozyma monospora TaxID=43982 RepID=A0ACB5TWR6_AMBMO|nr:unnamed protein product [Ambrosiozyma monospora]
MAHPRNQQRPLIPVVLACAISALFFTLIQVAFLSDSNEELLSDFQKKIIEIPAYNTNDRQKQHLSNSSKGDTAYIDENCLKYDYYQRKAKEEADIELEKFKKELELEYSTQSAYKIGQFDYNPNDIFYYDIGKGEPSFHRFMSEFIDFYMKHNQTILHPMREYREYSRPGKPEKVNKEEYWRTDCNDPLPEKTLRRFLENPKDMVEELTRNHKIMTDAIPNHAPFPFYKGNGYVMAGDGLYMWQALLNIEAFRALGSKLPIELLVTDEDKGDDTIF